jgi:GAF domain-containing protein
MVEARIASSCGGGVASKRFTGRQRVASFRDQLASICSLEDVMEIVTHTGRILLDADGITLVIRDGDLCYYAEENAISPLWKGQRFPMSACISGWCMLEGRSVAIADIYADPRIPADAYRPTFVKSLAMVPVGGAAPCAAMGAYWASRYEATAEDLDLLQSIADAAEQAIRAV